MTFDNFIICDIVLATNEAIKEQNWFGEREVIPLWMPRVKSHFGKFGTLLVRFQRSISGVIFSKTIEPILMPFDIWTNIPMAYHVQKFHIDKSSSFRDNWNLIFEKNRENVKNALFQQFLLIFHETEKIFFPKMLRTPKLLKLLIWNFYMYKTRYSGYQILNGIKIGFLVFEKMDPEYQPRLWKIACQKESDFWWVLASLLSYDGPNLTNSDSISLLDSYLDKQYSLFSIKPLLRPLYAFQ